MMKKTILWLENALDYVLMAPLALYFLPALIMDGKSCNDERSGDMYIMNFLLGWTGVGWAVLLFWALLG